MTSFLSKFKVGYEDIWKGIIRPPREQYEVKDIGTPLLTSFKNFKKVQRSSESRKRSTNELIYN